MHPFAFAICQRWKAQLDRAKGNDFTVTAVDVDIILRWLATAERLISEAERKGEDRVLNYFITRLPQRQTKRDWMPVCCMATVHQIVGEIRNRRQWD